MLLPYSHLYLKGDWYWGHSQDEIGHDYLKSQCFNLDSLHSENRSLDLPWNRSLDPDSHKYSHSEVATLASETPKVLSIQKVVPDP